MSTPFVGEIRMFGFGRTPVGWQPCDGRLLPISEYEVLYTLIDTTYGGDGQTTFAVPDLRSRLPLHQGRGPGLGTYVIGQVAGSETVTLNSQQMPAHYHTAFATRNAATTGTASTLVIPGAVSGETIYVSDTTGGQPFALSQTSLTPTGRNQAHENTMPTLTVQFCIAWAGIYPSQS